MERKMAFIFGRGKKISRWLRARPRSFFDWEKREGVLPPELCDEHKHEEGTPMLLEQATPTNVSRALREINSFEWEGDFKPMARQALKELLEPNTSRRTKKLLARHLCRVRAGGCRKTLRLPFDRLRANGGIWKTSKTTPFMLSLSKHAVIFSSNYLDCIAHRLYALRIFQRGEISWILVQVARTNNAPHYLSVARLRKIVEEFQNFGPQ